MAACRRGHREPVEISAGVVRLRVPRGTGSLRDRMGGGGMAGDGRRVGTARGYGFDLATAVRGGPERWAAEVDPGWTVAGRPNGGYLLALATRAGLGAV